MKEDSSLKSNAKLVYKNAWELGISYTEYKRRMAEDLVSNPDAKTKEYIKLNRARMSRLEKTYKPSAKLIEQSLQLEYKIYWLILTEHWYGDAAQNLPVFHAIEEANKAVIEMRLIYRDRHTEIMDNHLTDGSRSIPKLIEMDEDFNIMGTWGPRPSIAQKLVARLRSNPSTADTYNNELHQWYLKDSQTELEKEISERLFRMRL